jgi:hypothetical protein
LLDAAGDNDDFNRSTMLCRSASLRSGHATISAMVRPQPAQTWVAGSRRHTPMQGLAGMKQSTQALGPAVRPADSLSVGHSSPAQQGSTLVRQCAHCPWPCTQMSGAA